MKIVLAVNAFPASGQVGERNAGALADAMQLSRVELVNVLPTDRPYEIDGIQTLRLLKRDAVDVTGIAARRLPIVADIFDVAARHALGVRAEYFAFANADIVVTQAAVDLVAAGAHDAFVFSRTDVDAIRHSPL